MPQESTDRRSMRRFDMRLPASIRFSEATLGEFFTETQNVSADKHIFKVGFNYLFNPAPAVVAKY